MFALNMPLLHYVPESYNEYLIKTYILILVELMTIIWLR